MIPSEGFTHELCRPASSAELRHQAAPKGKVLEAISYASPTNDSGTAPDSEKEAEVIYLPSDTRHHPVNQNSDTLLDSVRGMPDLGYHALLDHRWLWFYWQSRG